MLGGIIIGFSMSMSLVLFGLEPKFLLFVDCVALLSTYWLSLQSDDDDHASIAKLSTAGEMVGGSFLYLFSFFFGLIIRPQDEHVLQQLFPLVIMFALTLTLVLVYWFVLATLTIGEKISIWFKCK